MPKRIIEEDEEEFDEEEEFEEDEEIESPKKKSVVKNKPRKEKEKKRYVGFSQPRMFGVADSETGEFISRREDITEVILETLADIVSRLESIEVSIGTMQG